MSDLNKLEKMRDLALREKLTPGATVAIIDRLEVAEERLAEQRAEVDKANALIDNLLEERDFLQRLAGERGNKLEAAEAKLSELENLGAEAMHCATVLEFIGNFESDDIDGDLVDLRFEIDGEDTGCDVSITEYALRSAKAIRAIISGASVSLPAPAVNLADLVPHNTCDACIHVLAVLGFNYKTARLKDVLSEVKRLRNIEEAQNKTKS